MRKRLIKFPVFSDYFVQMEIVTDLKKALEFYPETKHLAEGTDASDDGLCVDAEHGSYIFLKPHVSDGTVAHECLHAVTNLMEFIGTEMDAETTAYHLGYLVDQTATLRKRK